MYLNEFIARLAFNVAAPMEFAVAPGRLEVLMSVVTSAAAKDIATCQICKIERNSKFGVMLLGEEFWNLLTSEILTKTVESIKNMLCHLQNCPKR